MKSIPAGNILFAIFVRKVPIGICMRTTIFILLISVFQLALFGQTAEEQVIRLKQQESSAANELSAEVKDSSVEVKQNPGSWNLSVGTSYSYSKIFGSGMMYYTAPMFTMPLNNRWALHGGMIASHYQRMDNTVMGESLLPNSFSSMALFAAASYQMSDRLILHGTGVKQLITAPNTPFTPYPMDNLSLGATYKLGNNITIGASIHMNNGRGYYSTPFNGSMFQSPSFW